jgi:8-oxo-dGTP diphosphatase
MIEEGASGKHQIVVGLLVRDGSVLLCHRSSNKSWYPNVWDMPGGHVESEETPRQALVRELREELGLDVAEPREECLARVTTDEFEMQVWRIAEWTGSMSNAAPEEHVEIAWFTLEEAVALELAHTSYPAMFEAALNLDR